MVENKIPVNDLPTIGYEIFDHTADIGVTATGSDLAEVFENTSRGMYAVLFHDSVPTVKPDLEARIKLSSSDLEQLLKDWLDELNFIFTTE